MAGDRTKPEEYRFFSADSPWNVPIPEDAPVLPGSEETIAANFNQDPGILVSMNNWTAPIYYVDSSTPTYDVECVYGKAHGVRPTFEDPSGKEFIVHTDVGVILKDVPIPDGALPAPAIALRPERNADAHLCVVDLERKLEWDFCWMAKEDGKWIAGQGVVYRTDGDGVLANYEGSARGSGFPLTAGLIFMDELKAGAIEHALALALHPAGNGHVYPPASCSDGRKVHGAPDWGIPEGGLVQLDPKLDLGTLNLEPAALTIARAMQKYGMYSCDNSGSINLYAEGFPFTDPDPWEGLLAMDTPAPIPVKHLRVIDWGDKHFEEGEKPHNKERFRDHHAFPPLSPEDAAGIIPQINAVRELYKLPPYPGS